MPCSKVFSKFTKSISLHRTDFGPAPNSTGLIRYRLASLRIVTGWQANKSASSRVVTNCTLWSPLFVSFATLRFMGSNNSNPSKKINENFAKVCNLLNMPQINVRFPEDLDHRIRDVATRSGRTPPQIVMICCKEFLPVLELGIYGTILWEKLKQLWEKDLAEVKQTLEMLSLVEPHKLKPVPSPRDVPHHKVSGFRFQNS